MYDTYSMPVRTDVGSVGLLFIVRFHRFQSIRLRLVSARVINVTNVIDMLLTSLPVPCLVRAYRLLRYSRMSRT